MAEALALAEKISNFGFPTLLVMIIIGNYYRIWTWGWQLQKCEVELAEWKSMALRITGVAETTVHIAKTRERG